MASASVAAVSASTRAHCTSPCHAVPTEEMPSASLDSSLATSPTRLGGSHPATNASEWQSHWGVARARTISASAAASSSISVVNASRSFLARAASPSRHAAVAQRSSSAAAVAAISATALPAPAGPTANPSSSTRTGSSARDRFNERTIAPGRCHRSHAPTNPQKAKCRLRTVTSSEHPPDDRAAARRTVPHSR